MRTRVMQITHKHHTGQANSQEQMIMVLYSPTSGHDATAIKLEKPRFGQLQAECLNIRENLASA